MRNIFNLRYLKQGLLITTFAVYGSNHSYAFPQLQALQSQLQSAQTQVAQTTAALAQEQAARQQEVNNFAQCQAEKGATINELTQLQQALAQTQASHAAALAQLDQVHTAALAQAQAAQATALEHAHSNNRAELQQAHAAHNAALDQARLAHTTALEQAHAEHHQQLKQALEQAEAGHQQNVQETLSIAQTTHAAALKGAENGHAAALAEAQNAHATTLEQLKLIKTREQELEAELIDAKAVAGGGDPEQIEALKKEITRLKEEVAKATGTPLPREAEEILKNLPMFSNAKNFIHNIPPVVVDPNVDINKINYINAIRGADPLVPGGLLAEIVTRTGLPNNDPNKINVGNNLRRNQLLSNLNDIRDALKNPNAIQWDEIESQLGFMQKGLEAADDVRGGTAEKSSHQIHPYYKLALEGGQLFNDLKDNLNNLLGLKIELERAAKGNGPRQVQENLLQAVQDADQELVGQPLPPHRLPLNILTDFTSEIYATLPELNAIVDQIDKNIIDYGVGTGTKEAKESLAELTAIIKTFDIEKAYKFLQQTFPLGNKQAKLPNVNNHFLIQIDIRNALRMKSGPYNIPGGIPKAPTAFEKVKDLIYQFHATYEPLDVKLKNIFMIRDNTSRFNELRQKMLGAIPVLPTEEMNVLLNKIISVDVLALGDDLERNQYYSDLTKLKTLVDKKIVEGKGDPALLQNLFSVYTLCSLFENIVEASSQMYINNPAPAP